MFVGDVAKIKRELLVDAPRAVGVYDLR